jgi:alpha-tubulin suppressor-like RCC1 family protein
MRTSLRLQLPPILILFAFLAGCGSVKDSTGQPDGGPGGGGDLALGAACSSADACESGYCADGVCCESACAGQCEACDLAGTCAPVSGEPQGDRSPCTGAGTACGGSCDGVNGSACAYPTDECGAGSCDGTMAIPPARCDQGMCPEPTAEACPVACGEGECLTVLQVEAGFYATCALMSDGTVRCWGMGGSGQLGLGTGEYDDANHPTPVPGLFGVTAIGMSGGHACALLEDETVKCWGANFYGQLGRGTADNGYNDLPMPVLDETGAGPLTNVKSIAVGRTRTCAVVAVGSARQARCWGYNGSGALGSGTTADRYLPTPVCSTGSYPGSCTAQTNVVELAASLHHTCARISGGTLRCWGSNSSGQLAIWNGQAYVSDPNDHPNPITVRDPDSGSAMRVDTMSVARGETGDVTCAVRSSDKKVLCWGANSRGVLGRMSSSTTLAGRQTPAPVCTTSPGCAQLANASDVSVGYYHACAVSVDKVRCWGGNNNGQLGDGSTSDKNYSVGEVTTSANVLAISTGDFQTCALLLDGSLECWGLNSTGEVGTGDNNSPVTTPTAPAW